MKRYVLAWYSREALALRRAGLPQVARTQLLSVGTRDYAAGNLADAMARQRSVGIVRAFAYDPDVHPATMLARAALDLGVTVDSIPVR